MKGKKLFISGGAGFIATNLIRRVLEANTVVVYDSLSRNALKTSGLIDHRNLRVVQGDILDYEHLRESIPVDADIILHMAAIAGIDTVIKDPVRTLEVNMIGTYNILKVVEELGLQERLKRFVDFSTSEVLGTSCFRAPEKAPANIQPVGDARWTYAISKLAGEHLTHAFYIKDGLRAVTVRPFNVYGPGQVGESAIHHFVLNAVSNEPLVIHGDGDQIRAWCYVDDMVDGVMLCINVDEAVGEVFNIGNPRGTITIKSLAEKIVLLAGSQSEIVHVPKNYVDVDLRIPGIDKAKKLLGLEPRVDLDEGLLRTIQWYRDMKSL